MIYILSGLTGLLILVALFTFIHKRRHSEDPETIVAPPADCCGAHAICEKGLKKDSPQIDYFDDEELDVYRQIAREAYTDEQIEVFRDILYTLRPEEVEEFVTRTGCDSLAIAIGTSHGAYKFKASQCSRNADGILVPPPLRFDVLEECTKRLPGFPIVLHGSSSVPQEFVKMVNQYGGNMPDAIGIPEDELRHAAELSVCKINIDSDIRLAMTANIRKHFVEHPDHFDPRQYLKPARQAVKDMVAHKITNVLGSAGKA